MRLSAGLVILSLLSLGGYYGYRQLNSGPVALPYRTEQAETGTIIATATATGAIEPVITVLVGSQVSGTVVKWYADFNQAVQQGDILAQLDQERIQATIAQRAASLAAAEARAEQSAAALAEAALQFDRLEGAHRNQGASDFELESARVARQGAQAAVRAARAQVQVAAAELQAAEIELGKTVIRSPIDGVVISRNVDEGQTVAASLSAPTLFTIANDLRHMRVNAAVSETDIGKVREGMVAEFRVDAYPEKRFHGTVTQVRYAETVVDNVVTYQTLIGVDNHDLLLRPGMTATVRFEVHKSEQVLTVPNSALRFDPDPPDETVSRWSKPGSGRSTQPRVFRLAGETLEEVPVELGITDGSHTEIRGGALRAGDAVVVGWQPGARPRRNARRSMF